MPNRVQQINRTFDAVRDATAGLEPPVIVFNKSHSGSRMLAELISASGVFMGAHCNESWDSLDLFDLVDYAVRKYYPDYSALWETAREPDTEFSLLLQNVFARHLEGFARTAGARWGWK